MGNFSDPQQLCRPLAYCYERVFVSMALRWRFIMTTPQFNNVQCALCASSQSTRSGEHVWPRWLLLDLFPSREGPFTWHKNDLPILKRDGTPRTHESAGTVKVPACRACNGTLNSRFEEASKEAVRSLLRTRGDMTLDGRQATVVGLWFLKTWLLHVHPAAVDSEPGLDRSTLRPVPDDMYGWMIDGSAPPHGLSAWAWRAADDDPPGTETRHIPLPTVTADGVTVDFQTVHLTVSGLAVSVAYHPGWSIDHPLETEGRAIRMWPRDPHEPADFTSLPFVGPHDTRWLRGPHLTFSPETYDPSSLPPLSPHMDPLFQLPGVQMMFA